MADVVFGIIFGVLALAAVLYTNTFPQVITAGVPSASYFPRMIGIAIIIGCVCIVINGLKNIGKVRNFDFKRDKHGYIRMLITLGITVLYILLIGKIHFIILTSVYITALGLLYRMDWKRLLPVGIVSSVVLFYVFSNLFNVMLNG